MFKKKQLPVATELTVTLSHSYDFCDMIISFLSILGKLPSHPIVGVFSYFFRLVWQFKILIKCFSSN